MYANYLLGFRSDGIFLPFMPLQSSPSFPTWALKSPRATQSPAGAPSSTPPSDSKKAGYSKLSFGAYEQQSASVPRSNPLAHQRTDSKPKWYQDTHPSPRFSPRAPPDWNRVRPLSRRLVLALEPKLRWAWLYVASISKPHALAEAQKEVTFHVLITSLNWPDITISYRFSINILNFINLVIHPIVVLRLNICWGQG